METQDAGAHPTAPVDTPSVAEGETATPLPWPPPGLDRIQGDAYGAARWLAAGALLILPLLWAVVADHEPWTLSPLGDALWLVFLLGIAGIPILVGGYVVLDRLLQRASAAVKRGHDWRVVALTATDYRRDTGFLLQGAREFRLLPEAARRRVARNRVLVGASMLFAALWLSLGFGISVVLAARGVLQPWGVVVVTLGPGVAAAVVAALGHGWEEGVLRRYRRRYFTRSWPQQLVREEIRSWQQSLVARASWLPDPDRSAGGGQARTVLRGAYIGAAVATFMAFVPVFTLVFSAAMIPVLARISAPGYEDTVVRFAAVEPLRAFTLEPDTAVTAREAGSMLHTLSFVGRPYRAAEGVRPPERGYDAPWFPADSAVPAGGELVARIVDGMGEPLSGDELAYLERVAAHPAHGEMAGLARAASLDIAGVRWSMPLPSDITLAELSIPAMGSVRDAAHAHLARAAVQASRGEVAAADTTIREVLSVGLLMADESPAVLDNYIGLIVARMAGDALLALYRNTGHPDADLLAWGTESAARAADRARAGGARDVPGLLRAMPENTLDPAFLRGTRWDYVGLLNTLGPCMNLRRVVFGPDNDYRNWLRMAEAGLVRYPSEAEMFEVARGGLLGRRGADGPSLATRVLALTMGGADEPGSCARILGEFVGL